LVGENADYREKKKFQKRNLYQDATQSVNLRLVVARFWRHLRLRLLLDKQKHGKFKHRGLAALVFKFSKTGVRQLLKRQVGNSPSNRLVQMMLLGTSNSLTR
jgi:hypothetical protein